MSTLAEVNETLVDIKGAVARQTAVLGNKLEGGGAKPVPSGPKDLTAREKAGTTSAEAAREARAVPRDHGRHPHQGAGWRGQDIRRASSRAEVAAERRGACALRVAERAARALLREVAGGAGDECQQAADHARETPSAARSVGWRPSNRAVRLQGQAIGDGGGRCASAGQACKGQGQGCRAAAPSRPAVVRFLGAENLNWTGEELNWRRPGMSLTLS